MTNSPIHNGNTTINDLLSTYKSVPITILPPEQGQLDTVVDDTAMKQQLAELQKAYTRREEVYKTQRKDEPVKNDEQKEKEWLIQQEALKTLVEGKRNELKDKACRKAAMEAAIDRMRSSKSILEDFERHDSDEEVVLKETIEAGERVIRQAVARINCITAEVETITVSAEQCKEDIEQTKGVWKDIEDKNAELFAQVNRKKQYVLEVRWCEDRLREVKQKYDQQFCDKKRAEYKDDICKKQAEIDALGVEMKKLVSDIEVAESKIKTD